MLPVLLDDQIAARVGLKSDHKAGPVLRVQGPGAGLYLLQSAQTVNAKSCKVFGALGP